MKLTVKQQKVVNFINRSEDKQITKKQAVELIDDHYCNGDKHVGEVLSRMVKSGTLERVKNGVFKIGSGKSKKVFIVENQNDLFNEK